MSALYVANVRGCNVKSGCVSRAEMGKQEENEGKRTKFATYEDGGKRKCSGCPAQIFPPTHIRAQIACALTHSHPELKQKSSAWADTFGNDSEKKKAIWNYSMDGCCLICNEFFSFRHTPIVNNFVLTLFIPNCLHKTTFIFKGISLVTMLNGLMHLKK